MMSNSHLIEKYNVAAPRYTSYPTVPYWQTTPPSTGEWIQRMTNTFMENQEISLYIHLPFCESLCTYCGCNKRITKNHEVEIPYIQALLTEWKMYLAELPVKPVLKEIHLGGGTPTFFAPRQLKHLLQTIIDSSEIPDNHSFSFEAHPSSTTKEHLETLFDLGFNRISIGVQDFDDLILKIINRHQTLEQVQNVVSWSREIGYSSINFDLIFGLPLQTLAHIRTTMAHVADLQPDRIAFYSYAHVPWISPSQRAYSEADLPSGEAKRTLYNLGLEILSNLGYHEIGLDHFAKSDDDLYLAHQAGHLHRNFMGYTPFKTDLMIGLGASSISDSTTAFVQNEKRIEAYQEQILIGAFPIIKGHLLDKQDLFLRKHITALMCQHITSWTAADHEVMTPILKRLAPLAADGLIIFHQNELVVTEVGGPFIRNICMAFDQRLYDNKPTSQLFSLVI